MTMIVKHTKPLREAKSPVKLSAPIEATSIFGMAGLLYDTALTQQQKEYCESIRRSGDAQLTVINEVLDFPKSSRERSSWS